MVPQLLLWGDQDTSNPAERVTCAIDRLKSDNAKLTLCVAPGVDHGGIVGAKADYVADWIASKTLGEPAPPDCTLHAESDIMRMGAPATCATIPPND